MFLKILCLCLCYRNGKCWANAQTYWLCDWAEPSLLPTKLDVIST